MIYNYFKKIFYRRTLTAKGVSSSKEVIVIVQHPELVQHIVSIKNRFRNVVFP